MNSKTDLLNLFGKMCAFTDLLPNCINVSTGPREVTEVRLKLVNSFTPMFSSWDILEQIKLLLILTGKPHNLRKEPQKPKAPLPSPEPCCEKPLFHTLITPRRANAVHQSNCDFFSNMHSVKRD